MEYIGYILSFKDFDKCFYIDNGKTNNPFEAKFYFNKDEAIEKKNKIENTCQQKVKVIKVKKAIHIIE